MSEFLINTTVINIDSEYIQLYLQVIDVAVEGKKYILTDKADTLYVTSNRLDKNIDKTIEIVGSVIDEFDFVEMSENGELKIAYKNKEDFREMKDELIKVIQHVFSNVDIGYKASMRI